jgi:hypothetical protein
MAVDPYSDSSGGFIPPSLNYGMQFKDYGSYGLKQYSGWIREEFLPQLQGRQAATVYREMLDNNPTVGGMIFAITQAMRKVEWRVEPADDSSAAKAEAEFVDSLRDDMSHTWEDFVGEALSMLGYGFSVHEIVYKKRNGDSHNNIIDLKGDELPASKFEDGRIGWRRLPIRGQDTILKWFFDQNGQIRGTTQQPWVGSLIDIPIEKMLLFRPNAHKNNPEGRSVLRNAYRPYYFIKRLEEMEAILFERMAGFPVMYIPTSVLEAAVSGTNTQAAAALAAYKKLVTNMRIDEQMGAILPSDVWANSDGTKTSQRMYELALLTPQHGRAGGIDIDKTITRHTVSMMMTLLCDFLSMGHETRGTNNLGTLKVDMFYQAIQGWLDSITAVMNRYALPRLWQMNGLDRKLMPSLKPDMPQRMDLDGLGQYIANIAAAGMPLFPDDELDNFLRDAAGLPELEDPEGEDSSPTRRAQRQQALASIAQSEPETMKKVVMAAVAKRIKKMRRAA